MEVAPVLEVAVVQAVASVPAAVSVQELGMEQVAAAEQAEMAELVALAEMVVLAVQEAPEALLVREAAVRVDIFPNSTLQVSETPMAIAISSPIRHPVSRQVKREILGRDVAGSLIVTQVLTLPAEPAAMEAPEGQAVPVAVRVSVRVVVVAAEAAAVPEEVLRVRELGPAHPRTQAHPRQVEVQAHQARVTVQPLRVRTLL
jgi:hypothetical protein